MIDRWPADVPVITRANVMATVRNDEPMAVVDLFDPTGDVRTAHVTSEAAWSLVRGLLAYLHTSR